MSEALEKVVDKVCETLECDRASVFMLDPLNGELWTRVAKGSDKTIRIPLDKGIVGAVVRNEMRENIEDVYNDPRFNKEVDRVTGYRTKSVLCVPIRDQSLQVIGASQAINKLTRDKFTLDDECLFDWFTANAGIILRNSMRFDGSILNLHRTRQLIVSAIKLHEQHELDRFVAKAEDMLSEIFGDAKSKIYLVPKPGVKVGNEDDVNHLAPKVGIVGKLPHYKLRHCRRGDCEARDDEHRGRVPPPAV